MQTKAEGKLKQPSTGTPRSEMDDTEALQAENEQLRRRLEEAQRTLSAAQSGTSGFAGYMVRTPNSGYNGRTAGIQFRDGFAFIPQGENADQLARQMADDFGYSVEAVDDWKKNAGSAKPFDPYGRIHGVSMAAKKGKKKGCK